ncbi:efflux transporter outer membrane subunit [Paraburkholderia hayleyella]|uniref:efflux transporter outer membrane subunit n=1 Tax=Paraburkholderia hayleyella TaxID=2152889 RepID=UPI0012913912|nr:efflux transporter outer membrane subunit [Paraburkholderia hayleyella]
MPSAPSAPFPCLPPPLRPLTLAVVLAALLTGCALGPDYKRPATAVPAAYKEAADGWKLAQPADQFDRGAWWHIYQDPQLDALEDRLNLANQTIAQFAAAYRQARALVGAARAAYFPVIGASAAGSRSRSSSNSLSSSNRSALANSANVTLDATWEPDLWGKVSRSVAAQQAGQQGAAADLANARLSAQATLAQTYFTLRALDATQKLLDDTVEAYQRSLALTQNRYAQGVAARADVIQAQTQLQSAQAAAIDNGVARAQNEHAIAVLVGEPASTFSLASAPLDATPPAIPPEMPSALLERRPDIASAERKAAAANEQIGIAIAAFFPSLTLSASGGFQNSVLSQLFTAPARFWTVGPQLAATLFDAGLRQAQTEAARAAYDQEVALYRQTVLAAFQDVEDNLASQRILEREVVVQQQAVESAQQALAIVTNQYKAGTADYLSVLNAQTTAFSTAQKLASLAGQRMVSSVGLVKALGGGWTSAQMEQKTDESENGGIGMGEVTESAPTPKATPAPSSAQTSMQLNSARLSAPAS